MNRRTFLGSVVGGALAVGFGELLAALALKPNIVFIISDDAGYADFGFNGGVQIPTPHLDRLAKEGVVCRQGYVSASVCCPSRAGLITGRYQQRFGAECNVPTIPTPGFSKDDFGLELSETTMGDDLRRAGYRTMLLGKWHLGDLPKYHPMKRGFDEFYGFLGGSRSYWPIKKYNNHASMWRDDKPIDEEKEIEYLTDDLTDAAIEFIERNKKDPFFVYLSYNAVHSPMHAKEEDIEQMSEITPKKRRIYAAMTKSMDENVGRVTKALRDLKLEDNTMVVFVNDNGGAMGNSSDNRPLRGAKGSYWEGGIRVPFTVKLPGRIKANAEFDKPVSTLDLLPTFLAVAGGKHEGKELDGVNLLPYLTGENKETPHEYLFWRLWRAAAVRKGKWKLIRIASDPLEKERKLLAPAILIDMEKDPAETSNVAKDNPEVTANLLAALNGWEKTLTQPRWYDGISWKHWADMQVKGHRI